MPGPMMSENSIGGSPPSKVQQKKKKKIKIKKKKKPVVHFDNMEGEKKHDIFKISFLKRNLETS